MENNVKDQLVYPSTPLNVIEEFFPGENTYVDDEKGLIRASIVGKPFWDNAARLVKVVPTRKRRYVVPRENSIVVGVIQNIRTDFLLTTIIGIYDNKKIIPTGPFAGVLHISQVSQEYVKSLYDLFAVGDVILAKTMNNYNPYNLSTKAPGLGVILSSCGYCGHVLLFREGKLVCPRCKSSFSRLVSKNYYNFTMQKRVEALND